MQGILKDFFKKGSCVILCFRYSVIIMCLTEVEPPPIHGMLVSHTKIIKLCLKYRWCMCTMDTMTTPEI